MCKKVQININKERALDGLEAQDAVMKQTSQNKFPTVEVGKTVTIPTPSVDRGKGDARNVLGVVLEKTEGFYKLGTKRGTINTLLARNQFQECKETIINISDVPDIKLSLRETSTKDSMFGGQGFIKCNCNNIFNSKMCKCKRLNVLWNSKCHKATTCNNK
ncbi:uncharacterized protein LOC142317718 [Lycorma delicatula]|uniref:uncharacterized protein LOC142317718 n=1 Tax=Lycorma delicatula TaxID=130591 RepID=UPI003F5154EB